MIGSLLPSSVALSWGPGNDKSEAPEVLAKAANVNRPAVLFADAGYDAEWVHDSAMRIGRWRASSSLLCIAPMGNSMVHIARR